MISWGDGRPCRFTASALITVATEINTILRLEGAQSI